MTGIEFKKKSDEIILELKKNHPWIEEHEELFKDYPDKGATVAVFENQKITEYYLWEDLLNELSSEVKEKSKIIPENHFQDFLKKRLTEVKAWIFTDSQMGEPFMSNSYNEIINGENSLIWDFFDVDYSTQRDLIILNGAEFTYRLFGADMLRDMATGIAYAYHISELESKILTFDKEVSKQSRGIEKLKWNCSPSLLGFIITELANKGFIQYPLWNGDINPTGLAKQCFNLFEIDTTEENLIKEFNPKKCTLSETKRAKFTFPEIKDVK